MTCKIEKLSQTEPKTWKAKGKKKVEVLSPSNVASTSKTQNMGVLATRRQGLRGLGREWQASQGEYMRVRVGHAPLEAQEVNQERKQGGQEANKECEQGGQEANKEREQGGQEANQECEQGGQEGANKSCDSEVCGTWA